jgi:hypothetical protein
MLRLLRYHLHAMGRTASYFRSLLAASLGAIPAATFATCPVANQYNFSFANQAAATLSYATTYTYTATSTALGNQNFTVGFTTNNLTTSTVAGIVTPNIGNLITDGVAAQNLVIGSIFGARSNAAFSSSFVETTFTFPAPIRTFSVQVNDIDFTTNQFRDWLLVTGANGATTYIPSLVTPWGTNNSATGTRTNASSSLSLGAATVPVAITTSQAVGVSASGNNATTGTLTASFAEPVTTVRVRYGNYPLQTGETATGQQAIGIQQISYCPMPVVSMTKSSTPVITTITDPGRFNAPGNDVYYTLTVANTDSSPVDAGSLILTDILPPQMTFYNGDIDDAGPLTTNYEFLPGTSGLTFAAANLTYSNNGGTSYAYTPAAGYDAAVNAVRLAPQGAMPANSSFSIRFRTRIK